MTSRFFILLLLAASLAGNAYQALQSSVYAHEDALRFHAAFKAGTIDERISLITARPYWTNKDSLPGDHRVEDFRDVGYIELSAKTADGTYYSRKMYNGSRLSCFIANGSTEHTECKSMEGIKQ
jgi:hypothetical protein